MIGKKSLLSLTTISLTLPLGFAFSPALSNPAQEIGNSWLISQAFRSTGRGIPPGAAGGGTRGSLCGGTKPYVPLVPKGEVGLTLAAYPKLFVYVPEGTARQIKLRLFSRDGEDETEVGEINFQTSGQPGIVNIGFPVSQANNKFGLKIDQLYRWEAEIVCESDDDPSGNLTIEGWVQRVSPSGAFANLGTNNTPADYANKGIWYEALAGAAKLYKDKPNDPKVKADWEKLLSSVGLNEVATGRVIDCCTVQSSNTSSQ